MKISMYPKMTKDAANKFHKEMYQLAFPQVFEKKKSFITFEGLGRILGRGKRG